MELDYCHHRVQVRVASRVVERLKDLYLRKLGNFKKIPGMLGYKGKCEVGNLASKF